MRVENRAEFGHRRKAFVGDYDSSSVGVVVVDIVVTKDHDWITSSILYGGSE